VEVESSLAALAGGFDGAAPSTYESVSVLDLLEWLPWPSLAIGQDDGKVEVLE
jgi:hypothetical protein